MKKLAEKNQKKFIKGKQNEKKRRENIRDNIREMEDNAKQNLRKYWNTKLSAIS